MCTDPRGRSFVEQLRGAGLSVQAVGSKAAALDRVVESGCDVPTAFAITTDAYREFSRDDSIRELVTGLANDADATVDDGAIDRRFVDAPFPPNVAAVLAGATRRPSTHRWAVRSSATAEDLAGASFAGQYRSLLDIETDDLQRAIALVWASLWHEAPRRYRWFHGLGDDDIDMGVLVMEMVQPDHAGVVFTTDPLEPGDHVRVEIVDGLGEALVSGAVTPDVVHVDRDTRTPDDDRFGFVDELVTIGLDLEERFGCPQDIEWLIADGRVQIVQARPITTERTVDTEDDGFDDELEPSTSFTTAGIAEMLPGPLGPRLWTLNRRPVEDGLRRLFTLLGASESADTARLIVRSRGRAALDLDLMRSLTASVPGASVDRLEEQYLGQRGDARSSADAQPSTRSTALRQGARTLRARAATALESEIAIQIVDALLDAEADPTVIGSGELLRRRARLVHVAGRVMAAEIAVAAMATASVETVERFLARHLGPDRAQTATGVLTSGSHRDGETVLTSIAELDDATRETGLAVPRTTDWSAAEAAFEATDAGRRALDEFRRRLVRSGSMSVFGGRTWAEAPEAGWALWNGTTGRDAPAGSVEAVAAIENEIASAPAWRYSRAVNGHLVDVRIHFLRREVAEATAFLARREATKAALFRLGGIIRRIDVELGSRLARLGVLADPADIDLIAGHEIAALFEGDGPTPAVVNQRRRRAAAAEELGPLPRRFEGTPEEPATQRIVAGDAITGWGASIGRYTGRARVVADPRHHRLRRGDVLVASNTDASWAPLFLAAGAIVVEEGGPLSHAAIVARELGVPAVVNAAGVIDRVRSSSNAVQLSVDGSTGTIVMSESAPSEESGEILAGIVPHREPPSITDSTEPRLGVFVTGLIGAGAVMSAVFAATEAVGGRRAERRYDRRARPVAASTAHAVTHGFDRAARSDVGIWRRRHYAWVAAALALAASFLVAESTEAYLEVDAGSASILWFIALSTGVSLGGAAVLAAVAAWRWPAVPATVRSMSRLGVVAGGASRHRTDYATWVAAGAAAGFVALLVANLWFPAALADADTWLHDAMGASPETDRIGPAWLRFFGQPWFVIPLAIGIGVASYRCRVLAFGLPLAIVAAGLLNLTMWWIVGRERPDQGIHAGRSDSFPGGHAITVTLLFGLLPLAIHVVAGRRWLTLATRLAATAVMVILLVDQIRQGGHWPTDQLAGLLLGIAGVVALHGLVGSSSAHYRCRSCPWSHRRAVEP